MILNLENKTKTEIEKLLKNYNINMKVEEILHIQNVILKRPMTVTEGILFSSQLSEHASYKSSKIYLKTLNTKHKDAIISCKEDAGVYRIAKTKAEKYYSK